MKSFAVLLVIAPLAGCRESDPQLMGTNDVQSFNFALQMAQFYSVGSTAGVTGTATCAGQVRMEISEGSSGMSGNVIGDASFGVSFDDDTITGRFDQMILGTASGSTSHVSRSLALDAAVAGSTFGGTLKGSIGIEIGNNEQQVDVDLQTYGQFHSGFLTSQPNDLVGSATGVGTGDVAVNFDSILCYGSDN